MNLGRGHILRDYQFWDTLDGVIQFDDCSIYSYTPDLESDPYECSLWSYNYFFFNRKLKRILYFSLHSISNGMLPFPGDGTSNPTADLEDIGGDYDDYIMADVEV
ncbi:Maf1 regulator-domain-containing protein [Syncephalis pseudoplumigaleata]|uniref:Maf1 regulator-domain-containing protein n=1 Tax=Syncephalis pseudoplumigaleata TaxID=1712513 RepID=A0A4P9Z154_9FUNG|nr:Maf1 regulator-domain-containing protein [Syncephalis pseudoplumigaleata]|eukprot:RKP25652.1 Maf1 regulator-domain-containing protein [Syncephalis pseudoplumigaleata]